MLNKIERSSIMSFFANILKALGVSAATVGTQGCWLLFIDEPEMPRQLIK